MIADEAYDFLHGMGLVDNHAEFSSRYLGHSPRYYAYLRCSGADPSIRALIGLADCLADIARTETSKIRSAEAIALAKKSLAVAMHRCRTMQAAARIRATQDSSR